LHTLGRRRQAMRGLEQAQAFMQWTRLYTERLP
jgi:hypothetical protein